MKTKDMLEDYLLSLGVSIKNKYTFLPSTEYDFKAKKKDETVTLGKYKVKLTKQYANSRELRLMLNSARDNFVNMVTITEDMHKSCEGIVKNSIVYFTDLLKYLDSIIEIKPELMEKLIILCNGGIANVGKEIENALSEYSVKIAQAQAEGQADAQSSLISSMADIESRKSTYVTLDSYHDPIMGNRVIGTASTGFADKAMAEGMMAGARQAAAIIGSLPVERANKDAVEKLKATRLSILKNFNSSIFELVCAKLPNMFDEDIIDNKGNNLEENPTFNNFYMDVIKDLKDDQFDDFSKALEYYDVDIKERIKTQTEDNIYNYYVKEHRCDYNEPDLRLYRYFKFDEDELNKNISKRLLSYFTNTGGNNKKDIFKSVEEKARYVDECSYLLDDDKETVKSNHTKTKKTAAKNSNNNIADIILTVITIIAVLVGIIIAFRYRGVFMDYPESNYTYQILFGSAAVCFLTYVSIIMEHEVLKKILMSIIIIVCAVLGTFFNNATSKELAFREGKHKITWSVLDEKTVEFIPEGQEIVLSDQSTSGYVFNGWLCEYKYITKPIYAEKETYCQADLVSTSENLYTIKYKLGNGEKDIKIKYKENDWVYFPQDPVRKGYTFAGWYDETHKEQIEMNFVYGKTYDISVKAKWTKNK